MSNAKYNVALTNADAKQIAIFGMTYVFMYPTDKQVRAFHSTSNLL